MTRCLLVDDDDQIRTALADYLQRYALEVHAVADGVARYAGWLLAQRR